MFYTVVNGFSFTQQIKLIKVSSGKDKPTRTLINQNVPEPIKTHLSVTDIVVFSQKRDQGEWELHYLKGVDDDSDRCPCSTILFRFIFYRLICTCFSRPLTSGWWIAVMLVWEPHLLPSFGALVGSSRQQSCSETHELCRRSSLRISDYENPPPGEALPLLSLIFHLLDDYLEQVEHKCSLNRF